MMGRFQTEQNIFMSGVLTKIEEINNLQLMINDFYPINPNDISEWDTVKELAEERNKLIFEIPLEEWLRYKENGK